MKNFYSKTFTIGRLSVSILVDELIILYKAEEKVYVKKISLRRLIALKRPILSIASILVLVMLYSLFFGRDSRVTESLVISDEEKKNQILMSKETEYTDPEENKNPLVIHEYVVKQGESVAKIAKRFGISMETICGSNNLNSFEFVSAGTKLRVPNKDGIIYRLNSGEPLARVARRYNASVDKLLAANNVRNPDFFGANQYVFIPDAKPLNLVKGFIWPIRHAGITSGYGWRRHPIFGQVHFHSGIDVGCSYEWVKATLYGKVTYTGWLGGYGNAVIISHPGQWKSLYGHLSKICVRQGQYVKQGQAIAKSGNTGHSTGPHLHFELLKDGNPKNPYPLLK